MANPPKGGDAKPQGLRLHKSYDSLATETGFFVLKRIERKKWRKQKARCPVDLKNQPGQIKKPDRQRQTTRKGRTQS
jgi:hypothetical protein